MHGAVRYLLNLISNFVKKVTHRSVCVDQCGNCTKKRRRWLKASYMYVWVETTINYYTRNPSWNWFKWWMRLFFDVLCKSSENPWSSSYKNAHQNPIAWSSFVFIAENGTRITSPTSTPLAKLASIYRLPCVCVCVYRIDDKWNMTKQID